MKLRKIIPHLDFLTDAELYIDGYGTEPVWSGSTLSIQAAANVHGDLEGYLKDCREDEDFKAIYEVETVTKYLDYHLDSSEDGEAISFTTDGEKPSKQVLHIWIKKEK